MLSTISDMVRQNDFVCIKYPKASNLKDTSPNLNRCNSYVIINYLVVNILATIISEISTVIHGNKPVIRNLCQ